ncbi:lipoprotein lipase-like [Daktulosphaira vitifoliae]|uniref:lipoprotein lipase-like n=1 Tax=Daktulosphaira vitifoliae TaxID=58002 RepID=UPI0021AA42D3|nr:lipoprotein lipase-like [Daktulosphaira vitifoliae]XP_050535224.1 lipoprotein lipase-like [Daktulosphaira vitifoliae]
MILIGLRKCILTLVSIIFIIYIVNGTPSNEFTINAPAKIEHFLEGVKYPVLNYTFLKIALKSDPLMVDHMFAYFPENPNETLDARTVVFDHMKKVMIYIHGFRTPDLTDSVELKNALFEGADDFGCIILVDWRKGSLYENSAWYIISNYETVVRDNVPIVGEYLAEYINKYIPPTTYIYLVGHSLGAHISGIAARTVKRYSGRVIDRISAIDPAGPIFEHSAYGAYKVNTTHTLRKTDAKFVDVIHASSILGMCNEVGHLDIYIDENDCFQPMCIHSKAFTIFRASINKCSQMTCPIGKLTKKNQCKADLKNELSSLGYLTDMYKGRGKHTARFYRYGGVFNMLKYSTNVCSAFLHVELPAKKRICLDPPSRNSKCKLLPYFSVCEDDMDNYVCRKDDIESKLVFKSIGTELP